MEYFCTSCDELHELEEDKEPVTALDFFEEHPNAPDWIELFDVPNDELEAMCEDCQDAALIVAKAREDAFREKRPFASVF